MKIDFTAKDDFASSDMLIAPVCEKKRLDWLSDFALNNTSGLEDITGKKEEITILHPNDKSFARLCLAGIGKREEGKIERAEFVDNLRKSLALAVDKAKKLKLTHIAFYVKALEFIGLSPEDLRYLLYESIFALYLGLYEYNALKSEAEKNDPDILSIIGGENIPDINLLAEDAINSARAVCLARDLINAPANLLPPQGLAEKAQEVTKKLPITCTILNSEHLQAEGMNAILTVGRGSINKPVLVILEYTPNGTENDAPLIFVGKGLAFDSGGISLKPAQNMHTMKSDMSGAAAVLAAMTLIAKRNSPKRIIGLMPCAENIPDARAVKPGDVIHTLKGSTVEVLNTDAEGRLVLCDALTYAQRKWRAKILVDIATLTGACAIALGRETAGIFSNDEGLQDKIVDYGLKLGERFWPLPTWDIYAKNLKSAVADLANVGPREGGAISAALFLKHFVEKDVFWAHLDIAGTAFDDKAKNGGAAGFAVRTLAELGSV